MNPTPSPWRHFGKILLREGDVGGDNQVTDAVSLRYHHRNNESAVVDVYFYGVNYDGPLVTIEQQTCTTICTDRRDPGSTEVWSDATFGVADGGRAYATPEEAYVRAQKMAEAHDPRSITWDGRAPWQCLSKRGH
jgi:hypothetical protein